MRVETIRYIVDAVEQANPQRSLATLPRRLHKLLEELGEVSEAYLNATSINNGKGKTWADVREEAVDVLIVALDIALTDMFEGDECDNPKRAILHLVEHIQLVE